MLRCGGREGEYFRCAAACWSGGDRWCRTGAEQKNAVGRARRAWRMLRPPSERRPWGSSVSRSHPGPHFGQPGPRPPRCAGHEEQPWASLSQPCPRRWAPWPLCSISPPSGTVLPWGQPCRRKGPRSTGVLESPSAPGEKPATSCSGPWQLAPAAS